MSVHGQDPNNNVTIISHSSTLEKQGQRGLRGARCGGFHSVLSSATENTVAHCSTTENNSHERPTMCSTPTHMHASCTVRVAT